MISVNDVERRSDNSIAAADRFLPRAILALLACEILVPRVSLGSNMLTLDDIPPLLAGGLGILVVLRSRRVPRRSFVLLLLAWIILGSLTTLQTLSSGADLGGSFAKGVLRPFNSLLVVIIVHRLTYKRPQRIAHTIKWIVHVGALNGLYAVVSYTVSTVLGRPVLGLQTYRALGHAVARLVPGRFVGNTNTAANFVGAFFLMVIPLTLALTLIQTKANTRRKYNIALAMQVFGLITTFTRSSFLLLALMLFWMLLLLRKKRLLRIYLVLGGTVALIILLAIPEYILRFTTDRTGRLVLWKAGLQMMLDYPLLGVGFDQFMEVVNKFPARYPVRLNPHNSFIMLGAEAGIGMLLVGIGIAIAYSATLYRAWRRNPSTRGRVLLAGLLVGGTGFLLQNITNDLLYLPHLTTYFWLFYVLGANMPDHPFTQTE